MKKSSVWIQAWSLLGLANNRQAIAVLILITLAIAGLVRMALTRRRCFHSDAFHLLASVSVSLFWGMLAKLYSYMRTRIKFVLWFMGCGPVVIPVAASAVLGPLPMWRKDHQGAIEQTPEGDL